MNVAQRSAMERKIIRHLVRCMKAKGWDVAHVSAGGELVKCATERDVLATVTAVDEAGIVFKKDTSQGTLRRAVFIVLGNDGYDCICDHSLSNPELPEDDFEKVMREEVDPLCDKLAEQYT